LLIPGWRSKLKNVCQFCRGRFEKLECTSADRAEIERASKLYIAAECVAIKMPRLLRKREPDIELYALSVVEKRLAIEFAS